MNLRDFYRCLAEPVLTYRLHKEFIKAASENPERLKVEYFHFTHHKSP